MVGLVGSQRETPVSFDQRRAAWAGQVAIRGDNTDKYEINACV